MASSNILLRSGFWYAFIGLVIIILFIYGMRIDHDKTELQKTKHALQERNQELSNCTTENGLKSNKITELNQTIAQQKKIISEQENSIFQKDSSILGLQDTITKLQNKPPVVVTEFQDRIIYKDSPGPIHPYGKGYGKLTIYSECNRCSNIKVTIDGEYWGYLQYSFNGQPNCSQDGTLSKVVLAGKHHIQGRDGNNRTWDYYFTITEDKCNFWHYSY